MILILLGVIAVLLVRLFVRGASRHGIEASPALWFISEQAPLAAGVGILALLALG